MFTFQKLNLGFHKTYFNGGGFFQCDSVLFDIFANKITARIKSQIIMWYKYFYFLPSGKLKKYFKLIAESL